MSSIFISYRRVGALVHARALFERLRHEFGPNEVFIDLEGIDYGLDFIDILNEKLSDCQVMLAVIDPQWATALDRQGRRRIERETDYVRTEIATALSRGIRTVPVLIDGAEMPDASDLPELLRPLVRRNALILDFHRFDAETSRLIGVIRKILTATTLGASSGPGLMELDENGQPNITLLREEANKAGAANESRLMKTEERQGILVQPTRSSALVHEKHSVSFEHGRPDESELRTSVPMRKAIWWVAVSIVFVGICLGLLSRFFVRGTAPGQTAAATNQTASPLDESYRESVVKPCKEIAGGRYPFTANAVVDVPLADFARLFGVEGIFNKFFVDKLAPFVDTHQEHWIWRKGRGVPDGASTAMLRQFEAVDRIRKVYFDPTGQRPEQHFVLTVSELDAAAKGFTLSVDGQSLDYNHGPERAIMMSWPGPSPGAATATFEDSSGMDLSQVFRGPWGWFRFVDATTLRVMSDARLDATFHNAGHQVTMIIDATSTRNPYQGPILRQFSCGS
jgi:type VI secretion system (T6SS) IcmF/TssM family protein/TIR domain-containing protein